MTHKTIFKLLLCLLCLAAIHPTVAQQRLGLQEGNIAFRSEAPLELITASTTQFRALIDPATGQFAISIPITGFTGFNSALQQEHFYENYMETGKFGQATFAGKMLNFQPYPSDNFTLLLKGALRIHGVEKQRVVEADCVWIDSETLQITGAFEVPLADHSIEIPRVVYQKIAEVIRVNVAATMKVIP